MSLFLLPKHFEMRHLSLILILSVLGCYGMTCMFSSCLGYSSIHPAKHENHYHQAHKPSNNHLKEDSVKDRNAPLHVSIKHHKGSSDESLVCCCTPTLLSPSSNAVFKEQLTQQPLATIYRSCEWLASNDYPSHLIDFRSNYRSTDLLISKSSLLL